MSQLLTPTMEIAGLTNEQMQSFWKDAYLVIDNIFPPTDVALLREACDSPAVTTEWKKRDHENKTVHLLEITAKHPIFMELAKSPRILNRITPLIGPNIQLQHSKLATKPPVKGKGPFAWHQDFAYFPHTNTDLVAVMVLLDDATPENGCMQVVRGSHKLGLLNHMQGGLFTGMCQESQYWENELRLAQVTPKVGGISIHHCLALHSSPANLSGRPRRGVVFQYRADDAYQLADGVWVDTGLLICGEKQEQVRCDAGLICLPKSSRYQGYPFGHAWNQEGELAQQADSPV